MRADTHDGPEQIAPLQRPDTLMQLSRSSILEVHLVRTAGPYIMAPSGLAAMVCRLSAFRVNRHRPVIGNNGLNDSHGWRDLLRTERS
jgi:hypothetical protein